MNRGAVGLVEDRIGVANLRYTMSDAEVEAGIRLMLEQAVEILALAEVGPNRDHVLDTVCQGNHFAWARAKGGGPVLHNQSRYGLLSCKPVLLARREYVGHLVGRKDRLPPSIATECVYEDEVLGRQVVDLSYHLTAEVQTGKRYRRDPAHWLRVARHKREKRRLRRRRRFHIRRGRIVYLNGDGNFDGLQLPPSVSCWEGHRGATLGPRAVDCVHTDIAPEHEPRTVRTKSDHRGVVVVYSRRAA